MKVEIKYYSFIFVFIFCSALLTTMFVWMGDEFSKESFPHRGQMAAWYSRWRIKYFKDRVFDKVLVGNNGWLIYTAEQSIDDYQRTNKLTDHELKYLQEELDKLNQTLKKQNITLIVVIPPNKNTIYPEKVPSEILVADGPSRLDQLMEYMRLNGKTKIVDFRPALFVDKEVHQNYYTKDTHWNYYGVLVAYQEIISALQPEFPSLKMRELEDFELVADSKQEGGDLLENIALAEQSEDNHRLAPKYPQQAKYTEKRYGPRRLITSTVDDPSLPVAVIYHDSFFFKLIPLLGETFSRAIFIPTFSSPEIWNFSWVEREKPDIVILEFTERYIENIPLFVNPPD